MEEREKLTARIEGLVKYEQYYKLQYELQNGAKHAN